MTSETGEATITIKILLYTSNEVKATDNKIWSVWI